MLHVGKRTLFGPRFRYISRQLDSFCENTKLGRHQSVESVTLLCFVCRQTALQDPAHLKTAFVLQNVLLFI